MLKYLLALKLIPGIGDITARRLIAYCGNAEAVFHEKRVTLQKIPGVGECLASRVVRQQMLETAERELSYAARAGISVMTYESERYPFRLKQCADAPLVLFCRGDVNLDTEAVVAVVGTRRATEYGIRACQAVVEGIREHRPLIVSGLAYGIDTVSHRSALACGLPTAGVLAHGLDRIYPPENKQLAMKMVECGGALLSDFFSGTKPDKENFPKRNRIIAGLSDCVIVVEAARGGGALITAGLANSYNRDVFVVPGRWGDPMSDGCHYLVSSNRAALLPAPEALPELMNWVQRKKIMRPVQTELLINLEQDEELVVKILQENGESGIDLLCMVSGTTISKMSAVLLKLEMKNLVSVLPGKRFTLKN